MALPTTSPAPPAPSPVEELARDIAPLAIRPISRLEYDALVAQGLLDEDERIELLDGFIVTMSPQKPPHAITTSRLVKLLILELDLPGLAVVRPALPLALSAWSEPEPDVAVVPLGDYETEHPSTALLIAEVSDSSLRKDRTAKARIYARAGVPEYWIVNVASRVVEVLTEPLPDEGRYRARAELCAGDEIQLVSFPELSIPVEAFLPRT